ncbi:cell division protein FtsQ/DivIB [Calycomorphotria hydatis]|uniref:Cell division protein FtsQ n=1 Tax=Calycomorphotria hydatis TaxID=2528027 RepID=A0A517TB19_9PLAN|nr:hypothetical protein [Calycomorphotria hydatis]QDT65571.1 Cell division protein FtsQ [Calycomorphotria hydatis]
MAAKKRSENRSKRARTDKDEERDDSPSRFAEARTALISACFQPKRLLIAAILPTLLLILPGMAAVLPRLEENTEYRLEVTDIRLLPAPHQYVPANLVAAALERAEIDPHLNLLDAELAPKLAAALQKHPWIQQVKSVRKNYPAGIEIEVVYRKPVAMIDVLQGVYPVDATGCLLPPTDFTASTAKEFPRVTNIRSMPQGPAGSQWDDPVVQGAARIAAGIGPQWNSLQLESIAAPTRRNVEEQLSDLQFELMTSGGSQILWGRAPGTGVAGELTVEQKTGRLAKYLREFGGFDKPSGPYELDIRHWQEMTRRKLSHD